MKLRRVGINTRVHLDLDGGVGVAAPDLAKPRHQTSADMASTLPEELVEEILLRVPPDEPAHLVRASAVCKTWHGILSGDTFRRRYRSFHGTPPLLGYICTHYDDSTVRFVPTTTSVVAAAHPICAPKINDSSRCRSSALDCRHGRVLIETMDSSSKRFNRLLTVWDPIAGSQQHVSLPTYPPYPYASNYAGAVLCAKDGYGCDHLDCHGGPFLIVMVGLSYYDTDDERDVALEARVYSSETGAWSAPSPNTMNPYVLVNNHTPSLLIGDALYFTSLLEEPAPVIIKYDLRKNELSVMSLPECWPMLMKADDGGLGVAGMLDSCIHMWSWRAGTNGTGDWVKYRVMELDTQIPRGRDELGLICTAEGTNNIFIGTDKEIFMIDLNSGQARKIGQRDDFCLWRILPYMSFFTTKY